MKRIILTIVFAVIFIQNLNTDVKAATTLNAGTFILVDTKKILSTESLQEGDRVHFIAPADVWVDEVNIIPKNSIFTGYVSMLKMPIKGINGALKFKITHITLPTGETREIDGKITDGINDMFGGELAPPASYNQMTHLYQSRWHWSGTTQWVPSGEYEYGRHRGIKPGQKLFLELESPYTLSD